MRYNEQKVLPYIRAVVWRCYKYLTAVSVHCTCLIRKCSCANSSFGLRQAPAFTDNAQFTTKSSQ